jgi:hypothetical protein
MLLLCFFAGCLCAMGSALAEVSVFAMYFSTAALISPL